ncbi:MAG: sensor histidine kinase [Anaeromyxobacteraceae bacterium]
MRRALKRTKAENTVHRGETDESLRSERDKSDEAVQRRDARTADAADAVIEQARDTADEVLRSTRQADPSPSNPGQARARGEADAVIQRQRAAADLKLDEERRDRTLALASLFALERELTDQHLLAERTRADVALSNRDEVLATVAHDLRGLMGDIALRAGLLVRTAGDDAAGRHATGIGEGILRATAAMKRLVGDLLDIAAIEAGRLRVDASAGDLAHVLRDASEPFRSAAEAKGLSFDSAVTPESVAAVFDHDRVIQILGNLVSNAMKFTPRGGRLSLGLTVTEGAARISVGDTGAGIDPTKLEHIFERFTQLLPSDRRGLGLGLYIARCLVEAQGGHISATSAPGRGSTFSFTLPLVRA